MSQKASLPCIGGLFSRACDLTHMRSLANWTKGIPPLKIYFTNVLSWNIGLIPSNWNQWNYGFLRVFLNFYPVLCRVRGYKSIPEWIMAKSYENHVHVPESVNTGEAVKNTSSRVLPPPLANRVNLEVTQTFQAPNKHFWQSGTHRVWGSFFPDLDVVSFWALIFTIVKWGLRDVSLPHWDNMKPRYFVSHEDL